MRQAAIRQAQERAGREGVPCHVYRHSVWYVRTEDEGRPNDVTLEYTALPPPSDEPPQPAPPLNSPEEER